LPIEPKPDVARRELQHNQPAAEYGDIPLVFGKVEIEGRRIVPACPDRNQGKHIVADLPGINQSLGSHEGFYNPGGLSDLQCDILQLIHCAHLLTGFNAIKSKECRIFNLSFQPEGDTVLYQIGCRRILT
jgi:hypothetical protein